MAGTPLFLITDAGLAAASVAMPQGPYVHITSFQIGSGYGYTPQTTDTGINGNLLFTGVPTTYEYIGNNTLNIICEIPPDAGPFDFGEVAIFLQGGVMFAKAVFDTPQTKFSSLGTNVVSSYTLNCLLKLQQSTAIFQIDTIGAPPAVATIYQWSDVYPPGVSANPDVPLYLVRELSAYGDSTLLANSTDSYWSVDSTYQRYNAGPVGGVQNSAGQYTVANSSTSWVEILASSLHTADLNVGNRGFLLQTPDGFFRSVNSVVVSGSNYRFNLNVSNDGTYNNSPLQSAPAIGSKVILYRIDRTGGSIYYSQIVDPPAGPAYGTVGSPGLVYGSSGTYMPSAGIIQAHGMLQSPSSNTGRQLTGADNLNNIGLPSGVYFTNGGGGYPANMPFSFPANIYLHNIGNGTSSANGSDVTQIAYPWNTGGGDANGIGGLPPYWRQGFNSGANWTAWQPFSVVNKQGQVGGGTTTAQAISSGYTQAITQRCHCHVFVGDGSPNNTTTLTKANSGTVVSRNSKGGGSGYGRYHHDHGIFFPGDTLLWQTTGGVSGNAILIIDTF